MRTSWEDPESLEAFAAYVWHAYARKDVERWIRQLLHNTRIP